MDQDGRSRVDSKWQSVELILTLMGINGALLLFFIIFPLLINLLFCYDAGRDESMAEPMFLAGSESTHIVN